MRPFAALGSRGRGPRCGTRPQGPQTGQAQGHHPLLAVQPHICGQPTGCKPRNHAHGSAMRTAHADHLHFITNAKGVQHRRGIFANQKTAAEEELSPPRRTNPNSPNPLADFSHAAARRPGPTRARDKAGAGKPGPQKLPRSICVLEIQSESASLPAYKQWANPAPPAAARRVIGA